MQLLPRMPSSAAVQGTYPSPVPAAGGIPWTKLSPALSGQSFLDIVFRPCFL